jgi:predicted RND superfamily exporter protein
VNLLSRVLVFARRRRRLVLVTIGAGAVAAAALAGRVSFTSDVLALLPQDDPSLRAFRQYLRHFGAADQLYVVFTAPDGASIADATPFVDTFVARLRAMSEIEKVDAGVAHGVKDWSYLQERLFVLIGPAATQQALARLTETGMRDALSRSRDLLATPSPEVRQLVQNDPLGLLGFVRNHFASDRTFASLDIRRRGYVSADGRSRLVMATPAGPPFDNAFCRRLFGKLEEIERDVQRETAREAIAADVPRPSIEYAGGHRIALETEAIIKREATVNSVVSVVAILVMLLIVFRSPWLFLVGAIPMAAAALGSIAINGVLHRQLSAAATGTSALLFGLGIDGLVLMYARYLEELDSGATPAVAIPRLSGPGASMLLGCFTTAGTFFGLTCIDQPGLQELGRLVGVGMLLGGPLTLVLVAATLPGPPARRRRALSAVSLAEFVRRRRNAILIGAGVVTAAAIPLLSKLNLDPRLERLQPDAPAVHLQRQLGERFGVDRDVALVVAEGADLDGLVVGDRSFLARMRDVAATSSVSSSSGLIPPAAEQAATAELLEAFAVEAAAIQERLRLIALEVGFRPGAMDAFAKRLPHLLDPSKRLTYQGYLDNGLGDVISRHVVRHDNQFTTVGYIEMDSAAELDAIRGAAASAGLPLTVTGIPAVNDTLAGRFAKQFGIALAAGSAVVFVLMLVTFRSVGLTLLALAPTVVGLIWAAAILAALSVTLDLFSVFAILTLIGIGVDYGIHLVHRFASETADLNESLARVAPSTLVAAGIALLGCGSLAASTYPPLKSLGIVTIIGLITCLVTAILLLPAMLMLRRPARQ